MDGPDARPRRPDDPPARRQSLLPGLIRPLQVAVDGGDDLDEVVATGVATARGCGHPPATGRAPLPMMTTEGRGARIGVR
jgi:hypothetical protein